MINTFMRFGGLGRLARQIALSVLALGALTCAHAGETVTFFHNDIAGTPMLATDVNGNPVWKETYWPYGDRLVKASTSNNNKLWFTGKSYDEQTGLSYMGARYYDPALGRFMGIDPAPVDVSNVHSSNRYAYANNNPYRYVDPTGEIPLDTLWDAGNVVYDLGKITVGWTTGNQAWVVSGGKDLLLDAGAMALPYVPAGMQKIGREVVEQGVKLADKAGDVEKAARAGARATTDIVATRNGLVNVRSTLDRMKAGEKFPHRNDGSVFQNREGLLPKQADGYYREFVHPTPGVNGPGAQRIIQGQNGELYYSPDHYGSFIPLN